MSGMRPLRAVAAAGRLAALYLAARMPALVDEFGDLTRAPARAVLAGLPSTTTDGPDAVRYPPTRSLTPLIPSEVEGRTTVGLSLDIARVERGWFKQDPGVPDRLAHRPTPPPLQSPDRTAGLPALVLAAADDAPPVPAPSPPAAPPDAAIARPKRWSAEAYVFARAAGPTDFASAALLGGGQSGGSLAFTPRPGAKRPLSLVVRGAVAHSDLGSAQAALGLRWRVASGLSLSAERLFAAGPGAIDGWTVRLAGGGQGHAHGLDWSAYGEAGIAGGTAFADGQAFLGAPLRRGALTLTPGVSAWGAAQADNALIDRLDAGPSVRLRHDRLPLSLSADWRFRLAGNAEPGSGPALTLYASF